jgi:hypothetical protein
MGQTGNSVGCWRGLRPRPIPPSGKGETEGLESIEKWY